MSWPTFAPLASNGRSRVVLGALTHHLRHLAQCFGFIRAAKASGYLTFRTGLTIALEASTYARGMPIFRSVDAGRRIQRVDSVLSVSCFSFHKPPQVAARFLPRMAC